MILNLLIGLACMALAWLVPGRALVGPRRERPRGEHALLVLGVGVAATHLTAFTMGMLSGAPLGRWGVLGAAAAVTAVAAAARRLVPGARRLVPGARRPLPPAADAPAVRETTGLGRGGAVLAAIVVLVALGRFNASDLHLTCENYPTALLLGLPIGDPAARPALLEADFEQRLGTSSIVGPTVALLGIGGFRAAYVLSLLLIAGSVPWLVTALGGRRATALAAGALVLLQPLVGMIGEVDPNLNALAFTLLAFVLLRPHAPPRPVLAGLCFGLAFGSRYVLGPGGLALAALLAVRPGAARALAGFASGFALACIPWVAHNLGTYGHPFMHPSLAHFPAPQPHSFLGVDFSLRGALNWPFTGSVIRSPFNPYPSAVMYLQRLGVGFGSLGIALTLAGLVRAWRSAPVATAALVAYGLPTAALFAVLENWTEPTRLWLLVCLLGPFLVLLPLGLESALDAWRRRDRRVGLALLATTGAVHLVTMALIGAARSAPVDPRLLAAYPDMPRERPDELEALRRQYDGPGLIPELSAEWLLKPFAAHEWRQLASEISAPGFEEHAVPLAQEIVGWIWPERFEHEFRAPFFAPGRTVAAAEPVSLVVDLEQLPSALDATPLEAGGAPGAEAIDLAGRMEPVHVPACVPSWSEAPVEVFVAAREAMGFPLVLAVAVERGDRRDEDLPACEEGALSFALSVPDGSRVGLFYIRQVLPTVMFQFGAEVRRDGLRQRPGYRKV